MRGGTLTATIEPARDGPRLLLPEHHAAIERACVLLRTSALADDPLDLVARYRALEHALLAHMNAEEELLLPAYALQFPDDAAAIRAAHEALRHDLYRLGVDVELRCLRLGAIDRMIATLRDHAAHEDRLLYPWARTFLKQAGRRGRFERITRPLRALTFYNRRGSRRRESTPEVAE